MTPTASATVTTRPSPTSTPAPTATEPEAPLIVVLDPTVASSIGPNGGEAPTPDDCVVEEMPTATSTPEPVIEDGPPIVPLPGETPVEGVATAPGGDQSEDVNTQSPVESCPPEATSVPTATPRPAAATPTREDDAETPDVGEVPTTDATAEVPEGVGDDTDGSADERDSYEPTPAIVQTDPVAETPEQVSENGLEPTAAPVVIDPVAQTPGPRDADLEATEPAVEVVETAEATDAPFDLDQAPLYAPLPPGAGPVSGPLRFAPSRGVLVDLSGDGTSLALADLSGGAVGLGVDAYYPMWSESGTLGFAYYPAGEDQPSIGAWSPGSGIVTRLTTQDGVGGDHRDVPAGWVGGDLYYERTFPDESGGRVELRRVRGDGSNDALVWEDDGVQVTSAHPFPVSGGFAIATSGGWLLVQDGTASGLGAVTLGGRISQLEVGPGGWTAYADGQSIAVVGSQNFDSVVSVLPFSEDPGAGFSWSPDGARLAVTDSAGLAIFDAASGAELASWSSEGLVGAPLWTAEGVLFVRGGPDAAIHLLPADAIDS